MSGGQDMLRPRRHLHRGTVRAVAFWFDPGLLGEAEARRRVLAGWAPGAAVLAVAEGFLLRLPQPRVVASDAAPGLPLTLEDGVLTSAPLSARERERLAPREGSAVLVRAGVARVYVLASAPVVDLAAWLEVAGWVALPVKGLGAPPPPPVAALEPVAAPTRAAFGIKVPVLAPEARVMLARMRGEAPPPEAIAPVRPGLLARLRAALGARGSVGSKDTAPGASLASTRPGLLARLRAAMGSRDTAPGASSASTGPGLLSRLRAAFGSRAEPESNSTRTSSGLGEKLVRWLGRSGLQRSPPSSLPSAGPSLLSRLLGALFGPAGSSEAPSLPSGPAPNGGAAPPRAPAKPPGPSLMSRLSELLLRNPLFRQLLGQRKAEYVRRLFDMFEEGNLEEALRYAIPLDNGPMSENARVALGLPGPREKLTIQPGGSGAAASVFGSGEDVFKALRERYRAAFQRLEREGRIDEAAFVLAELLGAHEEAISFLERHQRFTLAAELAEGRNLAPGLVVRQWFLARNVARATAIARRSGAFADAVLRLERTHPAEARSLRLLWADTLAESGDWARAVQAVWPLHDARALARAWVERGVESGGAAGARLLALWATAFPDGLDAARGHLRALLDDDAPEQAAERFAFALTLAGESPSPGRTTLVVPTVRALLRDVATQRGRATTDFITRLLNDAPDGTLRADLPPLHSRPHRPWKDDVSQPALLGTARASDEGAFAIHDAVALPDGRLLLALGEAGARLLARDGRAVAHFDVPAFALVPSHHGDRAVALAPRGEVRRLSRLDLVRRQASAWCDARVDAWAPTYDGSVWFTAAGRTVMMVDALAPEPRALWRVTEVPAVSALAADAGRLTFLTGDLEAWTYDLAQGPTLRARASLLPDTEKAALYTLRSCSLTPGGEVSATVSVPDPRWATLADALVEPRPGPLEVRTLYFRPHGASRAVHVETPRPGCEALVLGESARAEVLRHEGHWQVHLSLGQATPRALLTFEGDTAPDVRLTSTALVAFDARGRLLWVDLEEGTVRHVTVT